MSRTGQVLLLVTLATAVVGSGCLGLSPQDAPPTTVIDRGAPPAPAASPAAGACTDLQLFAWRHDGPSTGGVALFDVPADVDRLRIEGAAGGYVSNGWRVQLTDTRGVPLFTIGASGVLVDAPAPRVQTGLVAGLLDDLLGRAEHRPTATPTASPGPVVGAAAVRTIDDPVAGAYRLVWSTPGLVHDLGVTVTAWRCAHFGPVETID